MPQSERPPLPPSYDWGAASTRPSAARSMLVQVQELSYSVAGRELLHQVSLHLSRGELLAVLGRNGAGKSTLLSHIAGDLGSRGVELFGEPLAQWRSSKGRSRELARRRAVLPQQTAPSFAYEVLDVVLLGRIPHGDRETGIDRELAAACLARVGLAGYETRNIQTLSGGEQQRVHLARVLAQLEGQPGPPPHDRVLLLDEPTASLDLAYQHATLRLARDLCSAGVGVLAVLHDLNLAAQYADRVLLLGEGQVLTCAAPREALTPETILAAYGHPVLVTPHPTLNCPLIVTAI